MRSPNTFQTRREKPLISPELDKFQGFLVYTIRDYNIVQLSVRAQSRTITTSRLRSMRQGRIGL
jgi:hypothetical protein